MDEIELKVHDMSSTLQPADAYALVLEEVNGNRKLPIIIGSLEAQAIKVVMMGYKMPRPLTHDLFLTVTKELGTALKKVLIYKVKDGVYYSYLFLEKEQPPVWNNEKFSFTQSLKSWNESNTLKYCGVSMGEFQVHSNRNCFKFRFNMKGVMKLIKQGEITL